jgi:hypothetical protein
VSFFVCSVIDATDHWSAGSMIPPIPHYHSVDRRTHDFYTNTITTVKFSLFLRYQKIRSGSCLWCAWAAQKYFWKNSESRFHALRQPFSGRVRLGFT